MSDTNRVSLKFSPESAPGNMSTAEFVTIPFTGTSDLGNAPETVVSELIRSDREVSNLSKVNQSVGGGFDTELIPGAFDPLLESVMQSTWVSGSEIISLGDAITTARSGTSTSITHGQGVIGTQGDLLRITIGGVEYFQRVTARSNNTFFVDSDDLPLVTGATDWKIESPDVLVNGITPKSFTIERGFEDANVYEYLYGMYADTFSVSASASSLVTASFGFLGLDHLSRVGRLSQLSFLDTVEETYGDTFNASSDVATIGEGSPDLTIVTEISLEITNNLRERNVLGAVGAASIGSGEFNVTGSMSVYFENNVLLEKLLENTQTTLSFGFTAEDGSLLAFHLPAIKFTEGIPEVSGKNEDVMLNLGFQAFASGGPGSTIRVQRLAAST